MPPYLHLFVLAGLVALVTSCTSRPPVFADQGKFQAISHNVGYRGKSIVWEAMVTHDFSDVAVLDSFDIVNGTWEIVEGQLCATDGAENRTILIANSLSGPLRIEFQATNLANADGSLGDITVLLCTENSRKFFTAGYALTTGSYYNTTTTFYRNGHPIAKTDYSPLVSGQTYRVTVEFNQGHIRYWLDDQILLETWDPDPLSMTPDSFIGLRTWNTHMRIDDLTIYRPQTP